MKARSGCAVDSAGKSAGKGALIQPVADSHILDDQGGQQINVRTDGKAPTLRAETHGNLPCVLEPKDNVLGFDAYNHTVTGDVTKCLTAIRADTDHTPVVAYSVENHPADSRVNLDESGKVQILTSRMGTGGGNVPLVMEPFCKSARARSSDDATTWKPGKVANTLNLFDQGEARANELIVEDRPVICLQGNCIDRADTAGCNGKGWNDETCYTLNTIDRPAVAYEYTYQKTTDPLMANSHPGSYSGQDAYTDMFVVGVSGNKQSVAGVDCRNGNESPEPYPTLQAKPNGGQSLNFSGAVRHQYIVRRLTPTECARLQGFPDRWGDIKPFNLEEWEFWAEVRNTHAAINGKKVQTYTAKQTETWYNKLHTDSTEYKMWGNGIALPTALYCMQGIAEALDAEEPEDDWMN